MRLSAGLQFVNRKIQALASRLRDHPFHQFPNPGPSVSGDLVFRICLAIGALFWLAHLLSLPLLVTYDGLGYIDLSRVLFSSRFPHDWVQFRAPLFPLVLKLTFFALGTNPMAAIFIPSAMALAGTLVLAWAIRRSAGPTIAGACFLLVLFYPTLITYEHAVLTEAGTFFFVSLLCALAIQGRGSLWRQAITIAAVIAIGYYWRQSIIYLALPAAFFQVLSEWRTRGAGRRALAGRCIRVTIIIIIPVLLASPWNRVADSGTLRDLTLREGIVRQALIPPDDPYLGVYRQAYLDAIRKSSETGNFYSGITWIELSKFFDGIFARSSPGDGARLFAYLVTHYPTRYLQAFGRSVLFFSGVPGADSDNRSFRELVLSRVPGSKIGEGPQPLQSQIESQFQQVTTDSVVRRVLRGLMWLYDALVPLGALVTAVGLLCSILLRNRALAALCLIPIVFLLIHAASLLTIDRLMVPVYPIFLVNILVVPALVHRARKTAGAGTLPAAPPASSEAEPVGLQSGKRAGWARLPAEKIAFRAYLLVLLFLCAVHAVYLAQSTVVPSTDEAHYMGGALSIANGLRSHTLSGAWVGYRGALGFKAPLVCVVPGILMALTNNTDFAFSVWLIASFAMLGLASYSLFRNCFRPLGAACASVLLLCTPVITGLTHRYYVELLVLLLAVVLLDVLASKGWRNSLVSALTGFLIGLGVLSKVTFPVFVAPAVLFSIVQHVRRSAPGRLRWTLAVTAARCLLAGCVAFATAWPWYSTNWRAVYNHAAISATARSLYDPAWIAADLSVAPGIPILLAAVIGLAVFVFWLPARRESHSAVSCWTMMFLLSLTTAIPLAASPDKQTRYAALLLPAFCALASVACAVLTAPRRSWLASACLCAVVIVLSLHNSFRILPAHDIRFGDIRILDSGFPLNGPSWFDDDAPRDRRHYPMSDVEERIASDAATRLGPGRIAEVRVAQLNLLVNFDYFAYLAALRHHPVHYLPWSVAPSTTGPTAPDYIIDAQRFGEIYPGVHNFNYYPELAADVARGAIPYTELFHVDGPEAAWITVYAKRK